MMSIGKQQNKQTLEVGGHAGCALRAHSQSRGEGFLSIFASEVFFFFFRL